MPLEAVIFDLDGVIVRTDEHHYQAWKRLADEIGVPFDRRRNDALRGVERLASLRLLLPPDHAYSDAELEALASRKNEHYKELIARVTPRDLLPGAAALLDDLEAHGVRKAVASASKNTRTVLERLGLAARFDAVVTGYDYDRGKPAPDIFLTAARRLGARPEGCLVIEDAAVGVEAARAAGMKALGLGDPAALAAADRVVPSLEGLSWADLAALMAGPPGATTAGEP